MSLNTILYEVADELRAVASLGLKFTKNGYDQERYERILRLSVRMVAALEDRSPEEVIQKYSENLSHFSPVYSCWWNQMKTPSSFR